MQMMMKWGLDYIICPISANFTLTWPKERNERTQFMQMMMKWGLDYIICPISANFFGPQVWPQLERVLVALLDAVLGVILASAPRPAVHATHPGTRILWISKAGGCTSSTSSTARASASTTARARCWRCKCKGPAD
jgi:hypothetical protein